MQPEAASYIWLYQSVVRFLAPDFRRALVIWRGPWGQISQGQTMVRIDLDITGDYFLSFNAGNN
jgi:hypothetical protein